MLINHKSKFRASVEPEFSTTVGTVLPAYPQVIALTQLRRSVERQFRLHSGAMYSGELEALVLTPLYQALRDVREQATESGLVVRYAYQLAAEYAVVSDVAQVSQIKEVARELTSTAITESPVYQSILSMANAPEQAKVQDAWAYVDAFLSGKALKYGDHGENATNVLESGPSIPTGHVTPLAVLLKMQSIHDLTGSTTQAWTSLVRYLKTGKGRPLSQDGAMTQAMRLTAIWSNICELCDAALALIEGSEDGRSPDASAVGKATFADAWTALLWFKGYLDLYDQYDASFPPAVMQQQSTAWVLALRNQALKLKGFYLKLSHAAQSFDVATFIWLWDEQMSFLDPALPAHLSAVSDLKQLWAKLKATASETLDSFSSEAAEETLGQFKHYLEVDVLLPQDLFSLLSAGFDTWQVPNPSPTLNGATFMAEGDTLGVQELYSGTRTELLTMLAASAGHLEVALGYLSRTLSIVSTSSALETVSLLPSAKWSAATELVGHSGEYKYASFSPTHPVDELMPKYTGSMEDSHPLPKDDVLIPKYVIPLMQQRATDATLYPDEAKIAWDGGAGLDLDIISSAYARQPLPALYTWQRAAMSVSATIENYEALIQGQGGLQDCKDTFWTTLANVIVRYRSTYGYATLDMIAATMFVYVKGDLPSAQLTGADEVPVSSVSSWTWLQPRIPVIYGAPTLMFEANQRGASGHIDNLKNQYKKVVSIPLDNGRSVEVAFVLHDKFPVVNDPYILQYPTTPTSYAPISVIKNALGEDAQVALAWKKRRGSNAFEVGTLKELMTAIRNNKAKGAITFKPSTAYYPGVLQAPHMLWSWYKSSYLLDDENFRKSQMIKVRVKITPLTGVVSALAVVDNPVQIVTAEEYVHLADSNDPSPISERTVSKANDSADNEPEKPTVEGESGPTPTSILPPPVEVPRGGSGAPSLDTDAQEAAAMAGDVSKAPILVHDDASTAGEKAHLEEPPTSERRAMMESGPVPPLVGDANNASDGQAPQPPRQAQFWKLMQDGQIVDVIETESAPAGYQPATKEEFEQFKKKGPKDGGKVSADATPKDGEPGGDQ